MKRRELNGLPLHLKLYMHSLVLNNTRRVLTDVVRPYLMRM